MGVHAASRVLVIVHETETGETREEAHGDPIPQNVNSVDQKSKVKSHVS